MIGEAMVCSARPPYRSKTGSSDSARSTLKRDALVVEICFTREIRPEGTSDGSMRFRKTRLASMADITCREAS